MDVLEIDATVGGPEANSYVSLDEADTFFMSHLYGDAWDDETDDRKNRALVTATRLMDTWFEWKGDVSSSTQALAWPRIGVERPNRTLFMGSVWPWSNTHAGAWESSSEIPARIKQATCEWAKALLESDRTADSAVEAQGLKRIKVDTIELEFDAANLSAKPIPDAVQVAVTVYGQTRSKMGGAVTLLRG